MYHFGDWIKLTVFVVGGTSISTVLLLTLYSEHATGETSGLQNGNVDMSMATTVNATANAARSKCRKLVMLLAKRMVKFLNTCFKQIKEVYPNEKDFQEHFQCTVKCLMTRIKMIDENDKFSRETFKVFLTDHIPLKLRDFFEQNVDKCIVEYETIIKPEQPDPLCTTYGDFVKCMQNEMDARC